MHCHFTFYILNFNFSPFGRGPKRCAPIIGATCVFHAKIYKIVGSRFAVSPSLASNKNFFQFSAFGSEVSAYLVDFSRKSRLRISYFVSSFSRNVSRAKKARPDQVRRGSATRPIRLILRSVEIFFLKIPFKKIRFSLLIGEQARDILVPWFRIKDSIVQKRPHFDKKRI